MIRLRTNPSGRAPPQLPKRAGWRHERDDEARWEAQIRRMAKHKTREAEPAVARPAAPVRTALDVLKALKRHDTLLIPRTLPIAVGGDGEDLACGGCGAVIASGTSRNSARRRHPEGDRLVVRCGCRALNLLYGVSAVRRGQSLAAERVAGA